MARRVGRNHSLSIAPFIAGLVLWIAVSAMAQVEGGNRPAGKTSDELASVGTSSPAQLTPRSEGGALSSIDRSQRRRDARATDQQEAFSFLPAVVYGSGGSAPVFVAVADLDGDGKPDLVVGNGNSIGVLLGKGDGTFQSAVAYNSGGGVLGVAIADVNGDGRPDIVVANGGVGVLLGYGDGTFQPVVNYGSGGSGTLSVAVTDVNGDGKPDIVVSNCVPSGSSCSYATGGLLGILLGNGDGTFRTVVTYDSGGSVPISVAVADVNEDGKPDLLVAETNLFNGGSMIGVLLGNGDGTFQPATFLYEGYGTIPESLAVADVNGDGNLDLAVVNFYSSDNLCGSNSYSLVTVWLGKGDGTFPGAGNDCSGGIFTYSAAVADLNGDGKPDVALASQCLPDGCSSNGAVSVLAGNGDGTFLPALIYDSGGTGAHAVAVADVNGDGNPDLLVANAISNTVGVLLNNNPPRSPTTITLSSSSNPSVAGQSVTFVAVVGSTSGTPTGVVVFSHGLGSATLSGGSASITVPSLVAGSYSITAAYQGSSAFSPSTSGSLNQVVNIATTITTLAPSVNPVRINLRVTYTAAVTSQYGEAATGTVTFQDGGSTIATVSLGNNQATYRTSYPTRGIHAMTATYSGDGNNAGSLSSTLTEQVEGFASKTIVTTSGSPSLLGQPVTFAATLTSTHGGIPDGELVTFYDGRIAIGTSATASGVATFTTSSLTAKTHTIEATYPGDSTFEPSSGKVKQIVEKYPTTTSLSSSLNPSQLGQQVTFTAQVTNLGSTPPTGKITFLDGTISLGSAKLSGGGATLTTSKLAVGRHPVTANYSGDADNAGSTSPVVEQVVQ